MVQIDLGMDLENVPSSSFEALPGGVYNAKISKAEVKKSGSGNNMISLTLDITEGEYAGRKLFDHLVLIESCMWKVKNYCEAIGITSGSAIDTQDFIGVELICTVVQEEGKDQYAGTLRNAVKGVSKVG